MNGPPAQRILMTADAVGGVWTYAIDLTRGLCSRGCEVTLVIMGPSPRPEQLQPLRSISGLQLELSGLDLEWMDPAGGGLARSRNVLLAIAERIEPDVVHLNSYREASFDWPAPVLVVAHSCVWSWWQACRGSLPDEPRWDRYAAAVAAGLTACDAWCAPTAAFRRAIETHYPTSKRGRVIPNGTDLSAPLAQKEPLILAAGRLWDEAKNLAVLDAAGAQVDFPMRVAGPTAAPDARTRDAAFRNVECLGVLGRSQMLSQLRRAAIFASPALYEPFGLSILEAAASGCALVLSNIPTLRELWDGAALFVEPRDEDALAWTLQQLCREDHLRAKMQQAASARARRYPLAVTVAAYHDLYRTMARKALSDERLSVPAAMAELPA